MLTVHADDAHQEREYRCQYESAVLEGVAHCEHAGSHIALQNVHQCFEETNCNVDVIQYVTRNLFKTVQMLTKCLI